MSFNIDRKKTGGLTGGGLKLKVGKHAYEITACEYLSNKSDPTGKEKQVVVSLTDGEGTAKLYLAVNAANETQQEIAFLFDPDKLSARHHPQGEEAPGRGADGAPRFDGALRIDLDIDAKPDLVRWSKPPLELAIRTAAGFDFRMIGVHTKSKAPYGARTPDAMMRLAIENRRKQLAQCIWLRRRVEEHLGAGDPLIVLGDFNDGPGLDEYEKLFDRSGLEVVLGEEGAVQLHDPAARLATQRKIGTAPTSARFWMADEGRWMETLLDYIMVSPDLARRSPHWRIWHPFDDPGCYRVPELREALLTASDHFPVTLDIDL